MASSNPATPGRESGIAGGRHSFPPQRDNGAPPRHPERREAARYRGPFPRRTARAIRRPGYPRPVMRFSSPSFPLRLLQFDPEFTPLARFRLNADLAVHPFDGFADNAQPDAGAFVSVGRMKP